MDISGSGTAPPESFGPAAARLGESSSDVDSGYQEAPADAATQAGGDEREARLAPNESEVPRESFAEQLGREEA